MSNSQDIELANAKQEFTITVYTENQIGILNRIAIIFSRRKINIESLNVSPSEIEHIHRFNILITETEDVVRKLSRQIEKQVEVLKVYFNTNEDIIWQELALYKVPTDTIVEKVVVERLLRENGARAVVSNGFNSKLREFERLDPGHDVIENEFLDKEKNVFTM